MFEEIKEEQDDEDDNGIQVTQDRKMSRDNMDDLNGSPKDPSGEGLSKPYMIPNMMSGGALSPSPNVSSPMLYNDGVYPATSLLDHIKMQDKSSNIGLQKQNTNRPSTRFELAFQKR